MMLLFHAKVNQANISNDEMVIVFVLLIISSILLSLIISDKVWFNNLALLIERNAVKKDINLSYEVFIWKHNGYVLTLYIDWQDFYDGPEAYDLPILPTAVITIYKRFREISMFYLDRADRTLIHDFLHEDYLEKYHLMKNEKIEMRVRGRDIEAM